ncbi:hypothetical protein STCU_10473 [Strigomonas culicis]|uniref:Amidohydrolase-related domain-containing protein n=1 Tax=Strigomonas culicis TaxID=28005 RepID=S9V492_9TRYP|nr:hypothetical protein STCU_10473 [Strigomonas culicis]|eukprot:EPY17670.1 hypothetical protein STCU_10473 [Strigomonas culicis]
MYFSDAVSAARGARPRAARRHRAPTVSGGPSASLFEVCRSAVSVARLLESGTDPLLARGQRAQRSAAQRVTPVEAFYVTTALGGEGLDLPVGRLEVGYRFDAMVVDTTVPHTNLHVFPEVDRPEDVFQKIVYGVHPVNIVRTYVDGRLVHERK